MKVARGEDPADLAVVNGQVVNVYTGEVLPGDILVKGERIAYVGQNSKAIASHTRVIDAGGRTVVPGFIDGHAHADYRVALNGLIEYAMRGGTTTIVTEVSQIVFSLGYRGILEFLRSTRRQPVKIFVTAPPMVTISPVAEAHALTARDLHKLYRRPEFVGLGEAYWAQVLGGDGRVLEMLAETVLSRKRVEGHSSGASSHKLQAYISAGVTSCHEPITPEEVLERLRLGVCILLREGEVRQELEAVSPIARRELDFRLLAVASDGLGPWQLARNGYMDNIVQKTIDLGFDPVRAVQMVTINVAQHFSLDDRLGGIAPGRYADVVVIPGLHTIRPEWVVSNGRVVAREGELLVQPRVHRYPAWVKNSVLLPRDFKAGDFIIEAAGRDKARVRVMDMLTPLVCREAIVEMPVLEGELHMDVGRDILKIAAIERSYVPGKTFVGLIRGMKLVRGSLATTMAWDCSSILVVGACEADMALAVNRLRKIQGGMVVCAGGVVLAEVPFPLGGWATDDPLEVTARRLQEAQNAAAGLGFPFPNLRLTLSVMTGPAIAFLRITESGLFDIRQNRLVSLLLD